MKKIIIGLMILASTQFVFAEATKVTKIKDIYVYADYIVMKMEAKHASLGCTRNAADEYLYLATNTDGGKKMYSAALSAYVAGKKVRLGISKCSTWGAGTIPKAYGISLLK